ncbi:MAG TPA: fused MFS/spermidine synthase [Methylomirabilota bacterium]|nr:fused MFS/spermidine synthase [Methylomirabilota bacterium]
MMSDRARPAPPTPRRLLLVLALASGAVSLVYQIVWMRRLVLVFGSATLATSTILVVFLGGLALGAWALGRAADRHATRALAIYGLVEVGIGLYALAIPWVFHGVEELYLTAYSGLERWPGLYVGLQFILSTLAILPPATLMGGTVPLLARGVAGRGDATGGVGTLYGWNTLGAALGAGLATYALLPTIGLRVAVALAAAVNLMVGAVALWLHSWQSGADAAPLRTPAGPESTERGLAGYPLALLLAGFGLSGMAGIGYEIAWTRLLGLVMGSSVYAFGTLVVVVLAGLGLGSALYGRLRLAPAGHLAAFGVLELLIGVGGAASLLIAPELPFLLMRFFPVLRGAFGWQILSHFVLAALIAFLPALLMGATFPAVVGSLAGPLARVGRTIGTAYGANTVGTVLGASLAGFVLIPEAGLRTTIVVGVMANLIAGGSVLLATLPWRWRWPSLTPAVAALAILVTLPPWPHEIFAIGTGFFAPMFATADGLARGVAGLELLYYRDGINTTISVDRAGGHLVYRSNGKTDASTYPRDMANQIMLGHVPMLLHPRPRDVFVLGLGTGVTAATVARHPVRRIDILELEPAALEAARFFQPQNRGILHDPRVRIFLGDGRNRLLAASDRYDVVISDASDIWVAGVGSLFTQEFYETVRARLTSGGVMVQWLHTASLAPPEFRLLVATFHAVFPYTEIWSSGIGDVILVGSIEAAPWVYGRLVERWNGTPGVREDLQSIGVWHPAALFGAFVTDRDGVARLVASVSGRHTDELPTLEFVTPRSLYVDTTAQLESLLGGLRRASFPPIEGFDAGRQMDAEATSLLGFAYASQGRVPLGIEYMERSVQMAPGQAPLWVELGHRYREVGRRAEAEAAYRHALAIDPQQVQARRALGQLVGDAGQAAEVTGRSR